MSKSSVLVLNDAFACEIIGAIAILRLRPKAFDIATDLDLKGDFLALLSGIEKSPDLKALLIINSSD